MKKFVLLCLALGMLLLTGCAQVQPEIKIVEKVKVEFIKPDAINYTYVETPTLPDNIDTLEMDEALDATIEYSIKLQTVIQQYEARVDSLKKWVSDVEAKQIELRENK